MHLAIIIHSMLFLFYLLISFSSKKKVVDSLIFQVYKLYFIAVMWFLLIVWFLVSLLIPFILDENKLFILVIFPLWLIIFNSFKYNKYKLLANKNKDVKTSVIIEKTIVEKTSYLHENIKVIKVESLVVTTGGHTSGRIYIYLKTDHENIVKEDIEVWYREIKKALKMSVLINVFINNKHYKF